MCSNVYILLSGRGGLIHETKLPMQELELKMQGGYAQGGVSVGFYGINVNAVQGCLSENQKYHTKYFWYEVFAIYGISHDNYTYTAH